LITAFVTVFFVFGLGFGIQRLRPLSDQTMTQLSGLVVEILLPFYLFFTTATTATPESLSVAPMLIVMGVAVPLLGYTLATLALKPSGVAQEQRSAFRFTIMIANTAFLGIPICEALFGPIGAVYAVLYDFGTTLVAVTLGIWELRGGRLGSWRPLVFNPLVWGVLAGLLWALTGWSFPDWLAAPFEKLGNTTLPLALLVGGAQIGNVRSQATTWRRQLFGLTITRLMAVPLAVVGFLTIIGWHDLAAQVIILEAAMPAGLAVAIMAKNYGADAEFSASALLWSTLASIVSLPLVAVFLI
jgi:predicted permease